MTTQTLPTGLDGFAAQVKNLMTDIVTSSVNLLSPRPSRAILIAPGESMAWDDCCEGQVWARLTSLAPLPSNTPAQRPGANPCAIPSFLGTFELGIVRCAATVNDRGQAPSPFQITEDGEQSINDMTTLLGILRCRDDLRSLIGWIPQGPEGGCHGGYWQFTTLVHNCLGCEEISTPGPG